MSTPRKKSKEPKTISIQLSGDDQDCLEKIAKEFGLIKDTDCLRVAVRVALRHIESQQAVPA